MGMGRGGEGQSQKGTVAAGSASPDSTLDWAILARGAGVCFHSKGGKKTLACQGLVSDCSVQGTLPLNNLGRCLGQPTESPENGPHLLGGHLHGHQGHTGAEAGCPPTFKGL